MAQGKLESLLRLPRRPLAPKQTSAPLVDFAAVADIMEINATLLHIELVEHTVIADAQFEFRAALQALVCKRLQSRAHFIHFPLHNGANGGRQVVERVGESG